MNYATLLSILITCEKKWKVKKHKIKYKMKTEFSWTVYQNVHWHSNKLYFLYLYFKSCEVDNFSSKN